MYLGTERRNQLLKLVGSDQGAGKPDVIKAAGPGRPAEAEEKTKASEVLSFRSFAETRRQLHELQIDRVALERRNAELRLAREQVETALGKYQGLYESAPNGYLTLGRNGAIIDVNLPGAALLGIEQGRLPGRHFVLFVAHEARTAFTGFLAGAFGDRVKKSCDVPLLKGGARPSYVHIDMVADATGKQCHVVVSDISARRRSESEGITMDGVLAARVAQLEFANLELEAFNYTVSHELSTPLTIIAGFSQVLETIARDQLDAKARGYLHGITEATLRLKLLIASLLDFSHVTRVELRRENVDLSAMAGAVAGELKQGDPESRVRFLIPAGLRVQGDASLCRIVLNNLIGNAWKHAISRAELVIEFGMTELGGKPVCFVCDNGPGFDMADAGKLFAPFQRIPGTDAQGHGVGLATVKRIVKRHGGRVWAESRPGEGATFFFTLE